MTDLFSLDAGLIWNYFLAKWNVIVVKIWVNTPGYRLLGTATVKRNDQAEAFYWRMKQSLDTGNTALLNTPAESTTGSYLLEREI